MVRSYVWTASGKQFICIRFFNEVGSDTKSNFCTVGYVVKLITNTYTSKGPTTSNRS